MRAGIFCLIATAVLLLGRSAAIGETVDFDLVKKFGAISHASVERAVLEARRHFATKPDDVVILHFPPGVYGLSTDGLDTAGIDVSRVRPSAIGRLILQGAGMAATTLVFDSHHDELLGRASFHVSFVGMHFTIGHMTVSQGHVVAIEPGAVIVRIEDGFPTPGDLFNPASDRGRYLRRCDDRSAPPHISNDAGNTQVAWQNAAQLSGRDWRIEIRPTAGTSFRVGDLLAIKSKGTEGGAYRFIGGADIVFDDVAWSRITRGVFRGVNNVKILNSAIWRDPPVNGHLACLSSAAGGPQIGQPNDPPTTGDVVKNFTASGTGDDALAFFNASGEISGVHIQDSFARGILLYESPNVSLNNIRAERAPVLRQ